MDTAKKVAKLLLQINAIKLSPQNPFTWASGILSPVYCDNRVLLSYPAIRSEIKEQLVHCAQSFEDCDYIAGVATAGIPHGALLADAMDKPFVYVRSKAKAHGRKNSIEGDLKPDSKVLVIEDLVSTGGSVMQAVDDLKQAGASITGVMAIFTYGFQKAYDLFNENDIPFKTLSNFDALIEEASESGYINAADLDTLRDWRKAPSKWRIVA